MSDGFISDIDVRAQLGISEMSTWRWDHEPEKAPPGWPARVKLGRRNFRVRAEFETFRKSLIEAALTERKSRLAAGGVSATAA